MPAAASPQASMHLYSTCARTTSLAGFATCAVSPGQARPPHLFAAAFPLPPSPSPVLSSLSLPLPPPVLPFARWPRLCRLSGSSC